MSFGKNTELGEVKISDQIIAQIILDAMDHEKIRDKIWPATVRGRQIGLLPKIVDAEFASNMNIDSDENDRLTLEFNVIVKFGESIRSITRMLADNIEESLKYLLGINTSVITINIAGVRSRQIARRNTKAVYRYED